MQSFGIAQGLQAMQGGIVISPGFGFVLLTLGGEHGLIDRRGMAIGVGLGLEDRVERPRRRHDVGHADGRQQQLAERAEVEHALAHALQAERLRAGEPVVGDAAAVVLDVEAEHVAVAGEHDVIAATEDRDVLLGSRRGRPADEEALEVPSLDANQNPELLDMRRRCRMAAVLTVPVLVLPNTGSPVLRRFELPGTC